MKRSTLSVFSLLLDTQLSAILHAQLYETSICIAGVLPKVPKRSLCPKQPGLNNLLIFPT